MPCRLVSLRVAAPWALLVALLAAAAAAPVAARSQPEEAASPSPPWGVTVGDRVLSALPAAEHPRAADASAYRLAYGRDLPLELYLATVDSHRGVHLLFLPDGAPRFEPPFAPDLAEHLCRGFDGRLFPVVPGGTAMAVLDGATLRGTPDTSALPAQVLQSLVDQVDADRWYETVVTLSAFLQRHTRTQGFRDARDWLAAQFTSLGFTTTTTSYPVSTYTGYNVIATLTGTTRPDEVILVGAHFDSLPSPGTSGNVGSPGAEDNGSGAAALVEMARIVGPFGPSQRTIVLVAFGGEEQGLIGSQNYVDGLSTAQRANLKGALIMDMIGYTADAEIDVLLETSPSSGATVRTAMAQAAADFTTLRVYTSDNPFGSDHMPFLNAGLPAVLAIENDWDRYPHYHQTTDTPANMVAPVVGTRQQGGQVVRMNIAALLRLANPDAPCSFEVAPTLVPAFPAAGGTAQVAVTAGAGCGWSVTGLPAWLSADVEVGSGNGVVTLSAAPNDGAFRASSSPRIAGVAVTVEQAAASCTFDVAPRQPPSFPAAGGSTEITITTRGDCGWSVTGAPEWISAAPTSGTGPGTVTLTVEPNAASARSATTLEVAGTGVTITQDAAESGRSGITVK